MIWRPTLNSKTQRIFSLKGVCYFMSTKSNEADDVPLLNSSDFYQKSWTETVDTLQGNFPDGLDSQQAAARLEKFGYNEVNSKKTPKW